jgi:hypothetical protein
MVSARVRVRFNTRVRGNARERSSSLVRVKIRGSSFLYCLG